MSYLTLTLETEQRGEGHGCESDEEEAAARRALAAVLDQGLIPLQTPEAQLAAQRTIICSCGHFTCPAVVRFGLPVPTFTAEIEPIRSQPKRDERALAIRAEMPRRCA